MLTLLPVTLAIVLLYSGALKLHRTPETLASMAALRVPTLLRHRWIAQSVPLVEMALAIALIVLPDGGYIAAAWLYAVLIAVFTILIAGALRRGDDVDCNCFGASSGRPVNRWTLVRNLALLAGAASSALGLAGSEGVVSAVSRSSTESLTWGAVAVLLVLGVLFYRSALASVTTTKIGAAAALAPASSTPASSAPVPPQSGGERIPIPRTELVDTLGVAHKVQGLVSGRPVVMIFVRPGCGECARIDANFSGWMSLVHDSVDVIVATSGAPALIESLYPALFPRAMYGYLGLVSALGIAGVPAAVLLGTDGNLATPVRYGTDGIAGLFADIGGTPS